MNDAFALLGFERRPAIDADRLKEVYLRLAARVHPDASAGDNEAFVDVQAAYRTLADPAARLRHLLALSGAPSQGGKPPGAELFLEVGEAVRQARGACGGREARGTLAKALAERERLAAETSISRALEAVAAAEEGLGREIEAIDSRWPDAEPGVLRDLAAQCAYLAKWRGELREWKFRLSQELASSAPPA